MNKLTSRWVLMGLIAFAFSQENLTWAVSMEELSLGVSNPSPNGAITLNPAGLTSSQAEVFDFGVGMNSSSSLNPNGSIAIGRSGLGYGIQVLQTSAGVIPTAAIAVSNGHFSMGLNAYTNLNSFSPNFDLGFRQELTPIVLGIVFRNISSFGKSWVIGFSTLASDFIRGSLDFHLLNHGSSMGVTDAIGTAGIEFFSADKLSLKFEYGIGIVPTIDTSHPGFDAGLNVWVSRKTSLYVLYQINGYDYTFGLKYLL